MKRTFTLLALLLAVMLTAVCALPLGMPLQTDASVQTADGGYLAAENRALVSRIYTLREGEIADVYEEFRVREGRECSIAYVAADETDTYFVRFYADGTQEIAKLTDGTALSLYSEAMHSDEVLVDLAAKDGIVWMTALNMDGGASVYTYEEVGGLQLHASIPASWLTDVTHVRCDGEHVLAQTKYGDSFCLTFDGQKTYVDADAQEAEEVSAEGVRAWLLCKRTSILAALAAWAVIALSVLIAFSALRRAYRVASRLTAVGAEVLFLMLLVGIVGAFWWLLPMVDVYAALVIARIMAVGGAAVWAVGVLVLRFAASHITKSVAVMTKQMDAVSEGAVSFREVSPGKDELHRMDRSLQEMCMSLSIRNYELESTIRSFERFVPEKLAELLERATVAEVELGDSRNIVGNVGRFSIGNRDEARNVLEDAAFVDFINHSFGIFGECVAENHGCMISSGLRFSAMDTMFPDAADGVQAGLDFLGKAQKRAAEGIPAPQPFLILHRAPFLYGVAGKAERLFPYISSGELEFLGSFAKFFHENGVRMVVTEAYRKQLDESPYSMRYIGFVSDSERGAYKLYEVLDAYSELERQLRMSYDQRFQEAINLFYRNDFFLARNIFSTLLRSCPTDGIARWYLFACEHFFNRESEGEEDYRLFGVNEA